MDWDVRPIADYELSDFYSIAGESLLFPDPQVWESYVQRVELKNLRGVYRQDRLYGGLAIYRAGQWFGGKCVPMAAVSAVAIDPAVRGSGACGQLLDSLLQEMFKERMPLATLYASTQRLYRSRGFEQSGERFRFSLPMSCLTSKNESRILSATRFSEAPYERLKPLAEFRGRNSNGNLLRTQGLWERISHPFGEPTVTYLLGDFEQPEGYVVLQQGTRAGGYPAVLTMIDYATITPIALQRLLVLLEDHRSMCDRVVWTGGSQDPILLVAGEQRITTLEYLRLLSRIVCFESAIAARGYPQVNAEIHLAISDPLIRENEGSWIVRVENGIARAERGGSGALRMSIGAVATLYSGFTNCTQLVDAGLVECSDHRQRHLADLIFSGPRPWMPEIF
ncbi:MAG: GNAT family N-acetyltransferase [Planctomycetales bacterium]|nr:GNAT family N-acetyltransferase [Planctomycetales bacterium]